MAKWIPPCHQEGSPVGSRLIDTITDKYHEHACIHTIHCTSRATSDTCYHNRHLYYQQWKNGDAQLNIVGSCNKQFVALFCFWQTICEPFSPLGKNTISIFINVIFSPLPWTWVQMLHPISKGMFIGSCSYHVLVLSARSSLQCLLRHHAVPHPSCSKSLLQEHVAGFVVPANNCMLLNTCTNQWHVPI